jgi:hypothetical protein
MPRSSLLSYFHANQELYPVSRVTTHFKDMAFNRHTEGREQTWARTRLPTRNKNDTQLRIICRISNEDCQVVPTVKNM